MVIVETIPVVLEGSASQLDFSVQNIIVSVTCDAFLVITFLELSYAVVPGQLTQLKV